MSDLINGLNALDNALPAYEEAERYYNGSVKELFSSEALRKALGGDENKFQFNYARIVITSRLSRMEIASITTEDDTANAILEEVGNANAIDQELQDAFEAALYYGDSYLIAWPDEEAGSVDIFYNDPKNTRVFYEVENPRKKRYALKRWQEGDRMRVNLYYHNRIEKYITKGTVSQSYNEGDFTQFIEEDVAWPLNHENGMPVFHLRTNRQYGTPEHKQAFGPQNAINKLLASQVSSIDFTNFPQRYFLEDPTANDGVNPQADFGADSDDNDDNVLANLKAGPGGVWNLKGVKQVGQFDPTSPDIFVTPFKAYIESMSTVTSTPMHAFNVGALPSGESLRAAEAPLNKRVESLEVLFGSTVRELHEYVLEITGFAGARVSVTWTPAGSYDDSDVWAVVDAKVSAGVPLRVALVEAGYTTAQVDEWYPEEAATYSPKELSVLADAIQKLSGATTLGILSTEEARALLPDAIKLEVVADPVAVLEAVEGDTAAPAGEGIKEKADAMGILIRAGVNPEDAARRVGLAGVEFTGAMPTSLRLPESEAAKLEEA